MAIAKNVLLQVNATILAGLLILLTIQSNSPLTEYFVDWQQIENKLEVFERVTNQTEDEVLTQKINDRIAELTIEQIELVQDARYQNLPPINPMVFFMVTMTPFIGSCIWEIHRSGKTSVEYSSRLSHWFSYVGFVMLFFSTLYFIAIQLQSPFG